MGGKALEQKGVTTERVDTNKFFRYYNEIGEKLFNELNLISHRVECYHTKETHGDLDILLLIDEDFNKKNINLEKWIKENYNPKAINANGGVISWEYNNFQIDFIPVKESNWDASRFFFDYSPVGNLMGKTAHKFGLSFGWDGLSYKFRNFNGRLSHNITISKNPEKIFKFLGFDFFRYNQGFKTENEIFNYVINSTYFDHENFKYENLNRIDRKRNVKRGDYNRFLDYVNSRRNLQSFSFNKKDDYIFIIDGYFPESDLLSKLEKLRIKDEKNKLIATKFNGKLIMKKIPTLVGKELGNAISDFKKLLGNEWDSYMSETPKDDIMKRFVTYYKYKL